MRAGLPSPRDRPPTALTGRCTGETPVEALCGSERAALSGTRSRESCPRVTTTIRQDDSSSASGHDLNHRARARPGQPRAVGAPGHLRDRAPRQEWRGGFGATRASDLQAQSPSSSPSRCHGTRWTSGRQRINASFGEETGLDIAAVCASNADTDAVAAAKHGCERLILRAHVGTDILLSNFPHGGRLTPWTLLAHANIAGFRFSRFSNRGVCLPTAHPTRYSPVTRTDVRPLTSAAFFPMVIQGHIHRVLDSLENLRIFDIVTHSNQECLGEKHRFFRWN